MVPVGGLTLNKLRDKIKFAFSDEVAIGTVNRALTKAMALVPTKALQLTREVTAANSRQTREGDQQTCCYNEKYKINMQTFCI